MNKKFQKGVSLYFVVITIMVMLSSIMVLSNILYIRTKMIKDAGDSVTAFYAADSGIEKSLYYKSQKGLTNGWSDPNPGFYSLENDNFEIVTDGIPRYGYKSTYTIAGTTRQLVGVGVYGKIKRGIIVKW